MCFRLGTSSYHKIFDSSQEVDYNNTFRIGEWDIFFKTNLQYRIILYFYAAFVPFAVFALAVIVMRQFCH